jgi:hypothetical protein
MLDYCLIKLVSLAHDTAFSWVVFACWWHQSIHYRQQIGKCIQPFQNMRNLCLMSSFSSLYFSLLFSIVYLVELHNVCSPWIHLWSFGFCENRQNQYGPVYGLFHVHCMILIWFVFMYEMSDFKCITQTIPSIIPEGKSHGFYPGQKGAERSG